jgi:hypothetical protein
VDRAARWSSHAIGELEGERRAGYLFDAARRTLTGHGAIRDSLRWNGDRPVAGERGGRVTMRLNTPNNAAAALARALFVS